MFTVWFASVGGVAVTGQKKELSEKLESPKPHQDLSPQHANGWKDLVIGVSEEERETFVCTPSPRMTPDNEPIELDLLEPYVCSFWPPI